MRIALPGGGWVVPGNRFDLVPQRPQTPPEVSVVIPYFDAQADLDLVLTALTMQSHPATRLQIVVADDGSATRPSLAAAGDLNTSVVVQPHAGFRAAAARNLGAAAADGEVVCFLDGDTVPAADYIAQAVRLPALLPDALVVGRREHADFRGWLPGRLRQWFADEAGPPTALAAPAWLADGYAGSRNLLDADDRSFRYIISAVLSLRMDLFRDIGGFSETFVTYGGEDWELAWRAWNAGAVLAHEPAAIAFHNGQDWAGRGVDQSAKNIETLALARLIPQRQTRGRGMHWEFPEIVVTLAPGSGQSGPADAAGWLACLDSLLGAGDVGIWLDEPPEATRADSRVHRGSPPVEVLARARVQVSLVAPLTCKLAGLAELTGPTGPGQIRVVDEAGELLVVTATRALSRQRRWASVVPERDLLAELHSCRDVPAADIGAQRLARQPDLAGHWDQI